MADIPPIPDAYLWTGGAGLLGRAMFHAREVQQGRRKPFSLALVFDVPIALAMGWAAYGLCVWAKLDMQPTISVAMIASYLGPYTLDRFFARAADRYFGGPNP
jgi:hypothetical protein